MQLSFRSDHVSLKLLTHPALPAKARTAPRSQTSTLIWRLPSSVPSRRRQSLRCTASTPEQVNISVDWRNHNIQILFVDRTDTIRSRLAVGMFERISAWNGLTLCLISYPCGLEPIERREVIDFDKTCALMSFASRWKFRPQLFTQPRQQFVPEDAERFNIIITIDDSVQAEVLRQLSDYRPEEPAYYVNRVCSLADFAYYVSDARLLQSGGSGLLDRDLRTILKDNLHTLRPALSEVESNLSYNVVSMGSLGLKGAGDVYGTGAGGSLAYIPTYLRPKIGQLSLQDSQETLDRSVMMLAICCAGLTEFLMDIRPPDLRHYDTDS